MLSSLTVRSALTDVAKLARSTIPALSPRVERLLVGRFPQRLSRLPIRLRGNNHSARAIGTVGYRGINYIFW